ncbi:MAG: PTS lactose/cellobiose transporter subunit IIA [Erysipelotrichaceae bacterium]
MKDTDYICLEIISSVGSARSAYIEAIQEAKASNYERCNELFKEANEMFTKGHRAHATLIQGEASGDNRAVDLLMVHAEDQLMSAEAFKILCREFIDLYKRFDKTEIK